MQVDDLLATCGHSISGEYAIAALEVKHDGFQLYPVPSEESEQFSSLQTAAAFVSSELLGSESGSEED